MTNIQLHLRFLADCLHLYSELQGARWVSTKHLWITVCVTTIRTFGSYYLVGFVAICDTINYFKHRLFACVVAGGVANDFDVIAAQQRGGEAAHAATMCKHRQI